MLESEIRMLIMKALHQEIDVKNPNYYLHVMVNDIFFTQNNRTTDCDVRFIPLTATQLSAGFMPQGWKAIVKKVLKAQEDIQKM